MPQLTIHLPDALMPYLNRKASEGDKSAEDYMISLLEMNQWQDEHRDVFHHPGQAELEDVLEARDKGPFIPVPDNLTEIVMGKVRQRLLSQRLNT